MFINNDSTFFENLNIISLLILLSIFIIVFNIIQDFYASKTSLLINILVIFNILLNILIFPFYYCLRVFKR